jgi:ABC-type microcin C transport system permease subunit YejE
MDGSIMGVITLIVVIAVGALVTYEILGSLQANTPEENAVLSNLRSKGETAFNLMGILVIVMVAVLIIVAIMGAFRGSMVPAAAPGY